MRISDWSSDVCSSDLLGRDRLGLRLGRPGNEGIGRPSPQKASPHLSTNKTVVAGAAAEWILETSTRMTGGVAVEDGANTAKACPTPASTVATASRSPDGPGRPRGGRRSEEHTSGLQSLMRISYAVFCLQKKNKY